MPKDDLSTQKALAREASRILLSSPDQDEAAQKALWDWAGDDPDRLMAAQKATRAWQASSGVETKARGKGRRRAGIISLLLALLIGAYFYDEIKIELTADIVARQTVLHQVELASGVIADLDAGSALSVTPSGTDLTIHLLAGSAYFDVASDQVGTVRVIANNVTVRVSGTAFAVETGKDLLNVSVTEGTVAIDRPDLASVPVPAGAAWRGDAETGTLRALDPVRAAAWRQGWLEADDLSLREVAAILDRRYPGTIVFGDSGIGDKRVTGRYQLGDPIATLKIAAAAAGGRVIQATPWIAIVMAE